MKVYVFGNALLEEDNLAIRIAKELEIEGVEFEIVQDINDIIMMEQNLEDFVMMDVVKGLKEVKVMTDISKIQADNIYSLHDFDLGYFLRLKHALGHISHIRLIGLPMKGNADKLKAKAAFVIKEMKKELT
jgi:Ni,Fe-hydrogenase maturation factor